MTDLFMTLKKIVKDNYLEKELKIFPKNEKIANTEI